MASAALRRISENGLSAALAAVPMVRAMATMRGLIPNFMELDEFSDVRGAFFDGFETDKGKRVL